MKLSNFRLLEVFGKSALDWKFNALVDVEKGVLFFKRKTTVIIHKQYGGTWFFADTGKFTPGYDVEELVRSFVATHGKDLQDCPIVDILAMQEEKSRN